MYETRWVQGETEISVNEVCLLAGALLAQLFPCKRKVGLVASAEGYCDRLLSGSLRSCSRSRAGDDYGGRDCPESEKNLEVTDRSSSLFLNGIEWVHP